MTPKTGYIHHVTDIKQSRSKFQYFNFRLQTIDTIIQGVSFEPNLQPLLKSKSETQKSITLKNYSLKRSLFNEDETSIVVNKKTKIFNDDCSFHFNHKLAADEKVQFYTISQIQTTPDFTNMSTKGQIHKIEEVQMVQFQNKTIERLNCKIADQTGIINITIWGEITKTIKDGQFYLVENARVRSFQANKYVSMGKNSSIQVTNTVPNVIPYNSTENLETATIEVHNISGLMNLLQFHVCLNCSRKMHPQQQKLKTCDNCGMKQFIPQTAQKNMSCKIHIPSAAIKPTLFQGTIEKILDIYNTQHKTNLNMATIDEELLTEVVLSVQNITITYNTKTMIVLDVQEMQQ